MPARSFKRIVTRPLVIWSVGIGTLAILYTSKLPDRPVKTEQKMEERTAAGKSIPVKYYTEVYWWKGAWPSLAICVVLLAFGKKITRPLSAPLPPDPGRAPPGTAKWVAIVALAAIAIGAWLNAPRLSLSLWDDEEYIMRRYVVGSHERDTETGKVEFDQPTWLETMFDARRLTNHTLYCTTARLTHGFHRQGEGARDPYFSEPLLRLPAFLAGLAALGALAWCLHTFGFYRAAMLAPFALLSHAWFTRMGVDARGYAFVLFAAPSAFASLALAVRTGRWRWWFAFIAFQFVLFFGFNGSVYLLIALNLTALLLIVRRPGTSNSDRWTLFHRYFGVTGIFALAGIFFFLPCLPQIANYMKGGRLDGFMDLTWWQNLGAYLVSGAPWFDDEPSNPLTYHLGSVAADYPFLAWAAIAAIVAAFVAGLIRFARSDRWPWLVAILATIPLFTAHNYLAGRLIIHWYGIIALPGILIAASAGATSLIGHFKNRAANVAFAAAALILVGSIGGLASRMNHLLRTRSYVPLRESVDATGIAVTNPHHPDFDKGVISFGFHQPSVAYDPGVWVFQDSKTSGQRFREIIARADAEDRPLCVNVGLFDQAKLFHSEITSILENPEIFDHVATLYGLYGASIRHVFRYRPGSFSQG